VLARRFRILSWALMTYLALLTGVGSILFIFGDPNQFGAPFQAKYVAHLALVQTHGVSAVLALCLGPFQFWTWLRRRRPQLHRKLGVLYLVGVVVAAITAFPMGVMAYGGLSSQLAFCSMAALWLGSASLAYRSALARQFEAHRRWMIRNYALTFGAVLVRVYLALSRELNLDFATIYPFIAWLSWVPTLIVAETWLVRRNEGARIKCNL
jgi:uncharacterized membrane protein